jgi:hypothetical protein
VRALSGVDLRLEGDDFAVAVGGLGLREDDPV